MLFWPLSYVFLTILAAVFCNVFEHVSLYPQAFAKFIVGDEESQTSANETQDTEVQLEGCERGTQHTDVHPPGCESGTLQADVHPPGCERRTQCKLKRRLIERCDSLSDEVGSLLTPSDFNFRNQNVVEGAILFFWNQYSNIVRKKLSN